MELTHLIKKLMTNTTISKTVVDVITFVRKHVYIRSVVLTLLEMQAQLP